MTNFARKESGNLYMTRVTFENIDKNPAIAAELGDVSYTAERIQQGQALHGEVETLFRSLVAKRKKRNGLSRRVRILYGKKGSG